MKEPMKRPPARGRRGPRRPREDWGFLRPRPGERPGPGQMTEYGWYDAETEREIDEYMANHTDVNRTDAIIAVFNIR